MLAAARAGVLTILDQKSMYANAPSTGAFENPVAATIPPTPAVSAPAPPAR
jgi:hypothetical protein